MRPIDVVRTSTARLRSRLLESLLVATGIAAAVAVIASTLSLYRFVTASLGNDRELREIEVYTPDLAYSSAEPVQRIRVAPTDAARLAPEDVASVRSASPAVAAGYSCGFFSLVRGGELTGVVTGDYFAVQGLRVREGTLFTEADESTGARVAVIGALKARALFPEGRALGSTVAVSGLEYTVIGVLAPHSSPDPDRPRADEVAFIPFRSSPVFERMRSLPSLTFLAASVGVVRQAAEEIRAYYEGKFGPGAVVTTLRREQIEGERERIRGVLAVLLLFGGGGLLVASANALNVLLARAARRVRTTGIEITLGASRASVLAVCMAESLTLAGVGCLAGLALAVLFNNLLGALFTEVGVPGDRVTLTGSAVLAAVLSALALNALLSAYPAVRSSRLNAADAIRTE